MKGCDTVLCMLILNSYFAQLTLFYHVWVSFNLNKYNKFNAQRNQLAYYMRKWTHGISETIAGFALGRARFCILSRNITPHMMHTIMARKRKITPTIIGTLGPSFPKIKTNNKTKMISVTSAALIYNSKLHANLWTGWPHWSHFVRDYTTCYFR